MRLSMLAVPEVRLRGWPVGHLIDSRHGEGREQLAGKLVVEPEVDAIAGPQGVGSKDQGRDYGLVVVHDGLGDALQDLVPPRRIEARSSKSQPQRVALG